MTMRRILSSTITLVLSCLATLALLAGWIASAIGVGAP